MNSVLSNQDLVEIIASKMDLKTICNFRLSNKQMKKYSKYEFMKSLIKKYYEHLQFQSKRRVAANDDIFVLLYNTELDQFFEGLNVTHRDFNKFYQEVMNDQTIYNIMILNANDENDLYDSIVELHKDLLEQPYEFNH